MPNVNLGPAVQVSTNYVSLLGSVPATTNNTPTIYQITLANLPTSPGTTGSGILWNNGGVVSVS
jgi:hypothetical protein